MMQETFDSTSISYSLGLGDVDNVQKTIANDHQFTRAELDYAMRYAAFEGNRIRLNSTKHQLTVFDFL